MSLMDDLIERMHEWRDVRPSGQRSFLLDLSDVNIILQAAEDARYDALGIKPVETVAKVKRRRPVVKKKVVKKAAKKATKKKARR